MAQIKQETAKLKQLSLFRPVEVQIVRAELDYAANKNLHKSVESHS